MDLHGLLEDSFTFYKQMMFVPQRKHTYETPWPVTGIALLFTCRWCRYLRGYTHTGLQGLLPGQVYFFFSLFYLHCIHCV
jgi:hypothetical protein